MPSYVKNLIDKSLLTDTPDFLYETVQYEVVMGSLAYGVSNDNSDMDIYGFAIPPKDIMFPHLRGEIPEFDAFEVPFQQYQKHHILDGSALGGKGRVYDMTIYSIAKYFRLLMENNPNIIDSLFVPDSCVLYATSIGKLIREQRQVFLHKGCWVKFKGYAYGQMHKIRTKQPEGKRKELVEKYGYDVKFAYHVVRLLNEVEQLLVEQNLDLTRNSEQLKSIRRGEWSLDKLEDYFARKEADLESTYSNSKLPDAPNVTAIRNLLFNCLEQHFGSLTEAAIQTSTSDDALREIKTILKRYEY
ncbi:MAG: nucleotidyltransferase domain-containing protein [Arenicella sp.]